MTITLHQLEINQEINLFHITPSISSHVNHVKFALFCAKDCFYLIHENNKPRAQHCIQLIESWLINPDSVTTKQLLDAGYAAVDAYAVQGAARAVCYNPSTNSYHAAHYAAYAFYYTHLNDKIRQQKFTQYTNYAYSLLRSTNITPTHTKGTIPDKATLMALLDELSDLNEDLIIYENNKVILNHPDNIITNTLPELVDLIWSNQSLLHYLEHLYDHSKT